MVNDRERAMKEKRQLINLKIIFVAIAIIVALFVLNGKSKEKEAPKSAAVAISVAAATRQDMPVIINEVGSVIAYETVALRSRIDSQITEILFKDGDNVNQGDLLFILDDRTIKADMVQAEANLQRDKAQLNNLEQQYKRTKDLRNQEFESQANLDNAKAAFDAQAAIVGATEATLESVRVKLDYTRITAPISGRTGTISQTVGNTVKANDTEPLVTINRVTPIRVQITLSQNYFDSIRKAMAAGSVKVIATRGNGEEVSEGELEYIDNTVNQASGTFIARAVFPNKDEALWPGMFVNTTLILGTEDRALTIPEVSVQRGQAGDYVFIIENGKAEQRPVVIARMQGGIAVIASGLEENEQVATDGLMSLKNGTDITVKTLKSQEAPQP